jgi:5-methylcytosine-specific restriction endonuclease McrA
MKLTKQQRETLRMKFGGRCAYCGEELGQRWHADHVEAVVRSLAYVPGKGVIATGGFDKPENDCIENLMPSCPPCNIDKHSWPLEAWRQKLSNAPGVLARNQPTYRHAMRFGLVAETGAQVVFHFERAMPSN